MVKESRQTLLTLVTLAVFGSAAVAQVADSGEQLPALQHEPVAAESKLPEVYTDERVTDSSPSVVDGWPGISVSDNDDPTCCEACSDESCAKGCCETCEKDAAKRRITVDIELMAQRTHFGEEAVGKLAEKYELAEKIILGVENEKGIGGRIRYWSYDRTTPNLAGGSDLRADFDVIDFEGTTRFGTSWFDLTLSSGIRWADIKIDIDSGRSRNDMPGGCFGLDVRGLMCRDCERNLVWRSISGARFSIFGGDWELQRGLIEYTRDDNITVSEIYGGIECTKCYNGREMYARLVFEAQNWRSDALGEATDVDSITFIGPGVNLGMNF